MLVIMEVIAGYQSINKLKESLARKQVPSCCVGWIPVLSGFSTHRSIAA